MIRATRLSNLLAVVPFVAGAILDTRQGNATTIPSKVESGIATECKTCPYSLCTNQLAFDTGNDLTLTCWTYGDNIVDSNIWLRTTDGCYVTQWDIIEYDGDYTNTPGFPYCGDIPQVYTTGPSATVYYTECNIIPHFTEKEDHIKMYKTEVDLTLTCYTDDGSSVLGNSRWFKTLSNCYVPEAQIEYVDNGLDNCGPIPSMQKKMRDPDPEPTPEVGSFAAAAAGAVQTREEEPLPKGNWKRWLYLTQIGADSANCTSEANRNSTVQQVLPFGNYIVVQCATFGPNPETDRQIYLLTDDFCWVNDNLADPQLIDSEIRSQRYPNCNEFVDTVV